MKFFLLVLLIIICSLIEASFVSLPLVLLFILLWSVHVTDRSLFVIAFLSGIVLDGIVGRAFGTSSVFLFITALIVSRYQIKIQTKNWLYIGLFTVLAVGIYQFVLYQQVSIAHIIVSLLLVLPMGILVQYLSSRFTSHSDLRI